MIYWFVKRKKVEKVCIILENITMEYDYINVGTRLKSHQFTQIKVCFEQYLKILFKAHSEYVFSTHGKAFYYTSGS